MRRIVRVRSKVNKCGAAQGFTLIEITVAAMLLLFAMAGIVPFFLTGLTQASSVRYKSMATNIAREKMEQIRQLDYREIEEENAAAKGLRSLTERFGATAAERDISFDIVYTVEESAYDQGILKKVTVNVDWTAPPAVSGAAMTTLIHQQFLGPRGSRLLLQPTSADPRGTPFPRVSGTTIVRYYIAQADWNLVFNGLAQATPTARNVYMRLFLFDDDGLAAADIKLNNTFLRYSVDAVGKVNAVWFEYSLPLNDIDGSGTPVPDGYWEMRAVAYNEYNEPGNVWRLRVRIEEAAPAPPLDLSANPQADNETVILRWTGGPERDRAYYVLERSDWDWENSIWRPWTPVVSDLDARATTYSDKGSVAAGQHPWGSAEVMNMYQYRLWAVDICDPGREGQAAEAAAQLPSDTTTTTVSETTTSSTTTTSTSSTTTTLGLYSVVIANALIEHRWVTVTKATNSGNSQVYYGKVHKLDSVTIDGLTAGQYWITVTDSTITASFSLPAQASLTDPVLTITN